MPEALEGAQLLKTTYEVTAQRVLAYTGANPEFVPPFEYAVSFYRSGNENQIKSEFPERGSVFHRLITAVDPDPQVAIKVFVDTSKEGPQPGQKPDAFDYHPLRPKLRMRSTIRDVDLKSANLTARAGFAATAMARIACYLVNHLPEPKPLDREAWTPIAKDFLKSDIFSQIGDDFAAKLPVEYDQMFERDDLQFEAQGSLVIMRLLNENTPVNYVFNEDYDDVLVDYVLAQGFFPGTFSELKKQTGLAFPPQVQAAVVRTVSASDRYRSNVSYELKKLRISRLRDFLPAYLNSDIPELKTGMKTR